MSDTFNSGFKVTQDRIDTAETFSKFAPARETYCGKCGGFLAGDVVDVYDTNTQKKFQVHPECYEKHQQAERDKEDIVKKQREAQESKLFNDGESLDDMKAWAAKQKGVKLPTPSKPLKGGR